MPASLQASRIRGLIYLCLLALVCAGAAARVGFSLWKNARGNEQAQNTKPGKYNLDWIKEYASLQAPPPRMSGLHPCIYESLQEGSGPKLGQCGNPSLFSNPIDQFEVDLRYGAFVVRQTDLFLSDGFRVPLTRAYTSQDWFEPNPVHAFGRNSNQTYDISPLGGAPGQPLFSSMSIALEDGDFLSFPRISRGEGYTDGLYRHTESSGQFYKALIYWNGLGWTAKLADGSSILFPDSHAAKKIADGAPTEIDDAAGNKLRLLRDSERKLQEIQTPHGHSIQLTYNDRGWIMRAEDDQGHWATYLYNADGMLVTVMNSIGKTRRYEYDGPDLTVIRDENDNVLVRNIYEKGWILAQEFPDGQVFQYSYTPSPNFLYAQSATVRFPDETVRTIPTDASVPDRLRNQQKSAGTM